MDLRDSPPQLPFMLPQPSLWGCSLADLIQKSLTIVVNGHNNPDDWRQPILLPRGTLLLQRMPSAQG